MPERIRVPAGKHLAPRYDAQHLRQQIGVINRPRRLQRALPSATVRIDVFGHVHACDRRAEQEMSTHFLIGQRQRIYSS